MVVAMRRTADGVPARAPLAAYSRGVESMAIIESASVRDAAAGFHRMPKTPGRCRADRFALL
ncbi:MAG: hypothetical protein ACLTSX_07105 [Collinsella sp.]